MISYYELLGLIKEGKQPKNVKRDGVVYVYDGDVYCNEYNDCLFDDIYEYEMFKERIEIMEEEKENNKIENLVYDEILGNNLSERVINKLNEVIDRLNNMEDK